MIPWGRIAANSIVNVESGTNTPSINPLNMIVRKLGQPKPKPASPVAIETSQLFRKISAPSEGPNTWLSSGLPRPGTYPLLTR